MARLKVFWTATAVRQRNHVFEYWNERNKSISFSKKLKQKLKQRVKLLSTFPNLGKQTEFKNTRTISLGHFSIFYKNIDSNIIVTGFWDNRQDPNKLLGFLKTD